MVILHWIFFVVSVIAFLISMLACYSSFKDEDEDLALYGTTSCIISTGLLIYSSFNIFSSSTAHLLMWSSLTALLLIVVIAFIRFIKSYIDLYYKILYAASILLTVAVAIILAINSNHSFCFSLSENTQFNLRWIYLIATSIIGVISLALLVILIIRTKRAEKMSLSLVKDLTMRDELYRDSVSDSVSIEYTHKLYELYTILKNRPFHKDEASLRDMVSFYLNDFKLPTLVKNRIIDRLSYSILSRRNFTYSEFQEFIRLSSYHANTEISLDNRYLLEEIVGRTKIVLQDELRKVLNYETGEGNELIINELHEIKEELISIRNQNFGSKQSNEEKAYGQYIRDLFHSLITPISQIEISTDIVKERIDKSDKQSSESLDAIAKSVKLLYAFLFAYRQAVFAGYASNSEDKLSINEGIDYAKMIYESNSSKKVSLQKLSVPNEIKGLSNNFVLAILLPLLENAVCATNDGQKISIEYKQEGNNHIFIMQNPINKPINIQDLYKDGYSSKVEKGKPHIGIGLSTVRNLLKKKMGSTLQFNLIENETKLETILTIKLS